MKFHKLITYLFVSMGVILIASAANAGDFRKLTLFFDDLQLHASRYEPVVFNLKKELQRKYPQLNLRKFQLEKAHIVAKSRNGRGSAQLQVKNNYSRPITIPGTVYAFHNHNRNTFSKIKLVHPGYTTKGPWKMHFRGNIILRKITLFVDDRFHGYSPHDDYSPSYEFSSHHYDPPFFGDDHFPNNNHIHSSPISLGARSWGTGREAERHCGQGSRNVRDGWDYPDSICNSASNATFRSGYQPVKLFIRPDTGSINKGGHHGHIKKLKISTKLISSNSTNSGPIAAVLGITIAGETFTRNIHSRDRGNAWHKGIPASFDVTGNWSKKDIHNARVWVLPKQRSGDFKVKYLKIATKKFS